MRGEYSGRGNNSFSSSGSPPHAWGIQIKRAGAGRQPRFTPTCVGNTLFPAILPCPATVHPHMRGEYFPSLFHFIYYIGSPPHAWGILSPILWGLSEWRFTPTCVGNTWTRIPRRPR